MDTTINPVQYTHTRARALCVYACVHACVRAYVRACVSSIYFKTEVTLVYSILYTHIPELFRYLINVDASGNRVRSPEHKSAPTPFLE